MGAVHLVVSGMDFKIMKICTIILFIIMTIAVKVLVLLTISLGTLFLENVIFIYGWMPAHMALVTAAVIFLRNIKKIKNKYIRFYYSTIKSRLQLATCTATTALSHKSLARACTAHHPETHPLHTHKTITNPWPLPMPNNCSLFPGSLLLPHYILICSRNIFRVYRKTSQ